MSYSKNEEGDEVYPDRENVYILSQEDGSVQFAKSRYGHETYAYRKDDQSLIVPFDSNGIIQYAKRIDGVENYPRHFPVNFKNKDGTDPRYARDASGNEFYPHNVESDFLFGNRYAQKSSGKPFYPRYASGEEFVVGDKYIETDEGNVVYPVDPSGEPIYPLVDGKEVYVERNGRYHIARNSSGLFRYAHDQNENEYYPPDGSVAMILGGTTPLYARTKDGKILTLKEGEYLRDGIDARVEMYPLDPADGSEIIVGEKYAHDDDNGFYYPMDVNGNEYPLRLSSGDVKLIPSSYPISNDRYIIIPENKEGNPILNSELTKKNIVGKLYRGENEGYRDYLTNVKSDRYSRSSTTGKHKIRVIKDTSETKNICSNLWIIFIVFAILLVVVIMFLICM